MDNLGFSGFGPSANENTRFFYRSGSTVTTDFQQWTKPVGCSFVYIYVIGSGAGGGGGASGTSSTARGGGGGGGSGSSARALFPAVLLPDIMYIYVAPGGAGGAAGGVGTAGAASYVFANPAATASSLSTAIINTNGGLGGGAGTASTGGAAGSGNTATPLSSMPFGNFAVFGTVSNGVPGAAGGAQTGVNGSTITLLNGYNLHGGTGGGGVTSVDTTGGTINGLVYIQSIPGGIAAGGAGTHGIINRKPFFSLGGTGGGTNNNGVGGAGGNGNIGCGGGGGGGGVTGGAGGNGGDGMILIISF